jgi:arabinofuranosyltransferase
MPLKKPFLTDLLISVLLIIATFYYAAQYVDFTIPPFEDAAMLMRYSQHLAGGHGIVWNIGESPVDGATDFLFMASAALLIKSGLTVGQAVRGIGFVSHLLTVLIVYWTNRRVHDGNIFLSLFSALYLVVGTGLSYVAAYFGTPYFALAAASTWTLGLMLMKQQTPRFGLILTFALSGLVTGLIRPEGVILASLMLLSVVVMRGWKNSISIIVTFGLVFLVLGGTYFAWRWNYFGYPLPNPFYKKGDAGLHWDSFHASLWNTLRFSLPFAIAALLGFRSRDMTLAYLIPILGFASAFVLISDEMNFGARFQYALLPIVLMSWIPLLSGFSFSWLDQLSVKERGAYIVAFAALAFSLIYYSWFQNCSLTSFQQSCNRPYERDGRYEMAKLLAEHRDKGYTIATTEAGLLPYYSGWNAIDTWGLNDQFIAHNGAITMEYLDTYKPEIIMFHDYYSPLVPPKLTEPNLAQRWFGMTILLKTYAEENGYMLAAVFGDSPYDTHYYYVRTDFEDSKRIFEQISKMRNYYWPITGKRSINYAGFE